MGKRKEVPRKTSIKRGGGEEKEKGFYSCYLLASVSPRHKGHSYIGFTVNPRRRIRQHNGEIRCGAWRTKRKRPWEMVLCIYGFPTNVSALQFEWAWQHPTESLAVRKAAANMKSLSGIANKIKLAYTMLSLSSWHSLNLTVNFFSTKYMEHCASCPSLPEHMRIEVRPMDELWCYEEDDNCSYENEDDGADKQESDEAGWISGSIREESKELMLHSAVDDQSGDELQGSEQLGLIEENGMGQKWDSHTSEEDHRETHHPPDSPVRPLDFMVSFPNEKEIKTGLAEEISFELGRSTRKEFPTIVDCINDQLASSHTAPHEVEIIDVLTPSPDCRISLWNSKKKRISSGYPEIIDLTKSPMFIQL